MVYSCNLRTGETTGMIDGTSDMHLDMFKDYLICRQAHIGHPMLLAIMMLEILTHLSIARRNVHQKALFDLEVSLGVTRGRGIPGLPDQRSLSQLEINTPKCNRLITSLTYLERRLDFAKSLADAISSVLSNTLSGAPRGMVNLCDPSLLTLCDDYSETVSNCSSFLGNQMHLAACLQKRAQTLLNVVCSTFKQGWLAK
jgi:hypothetical protein